MSEMIDRQVALEKLKNYIVDPERAISENPDDVFQYNSGIRTAVGVIMELRTSSPWHSMEDNGPPEENGPYLVYAPSYRGGSSSAKESARGVMISKWTGKHWSIEVGYYKRPGCVTHWMPIEPPKEDA